MSASLTSNVGWAALTVCASLVLTGGTWLVLQRHVPAVAATAGCAGLFAVFGQTLDAVSTFVGVDVLSFVEQVPLSRSILDATAALPTAPLLGSAWLFVGLKVGLAVALVALLADPRRPLGATDRLALLAAGAFGLVPGLSNLWLYATA
ncbi:DUF63 family protein [Halomarina ordinaria]|uniref:DUF63 family protein n=1 Tax=Halomarina ordinaria TaxID=3033939 RepID=A0ABD5U666_9EURY|nr:DUF63 family protein [Halomarina sp. PSRA2]